MFTFKHSMLVIGFFVAGLVACGGGGGNEPDAFNLGQGGALGTGGAENGGAIGTGGSSVGIDATSGSGGGFVDAESPALDALAGETGAPPMVCTKETNLALINAPPASGVTAVDVPGPTPPTYDPNTNTCK